MGMTRADARSFLAATLAQALTDAGLANTDTGIRSRQMLPTFPSLDVANCFVRDVEICRDFALSFAPERASLTNADDIVVSEFRPVATLAQRVPQFRLHIPVIVGVRSPEQMVWTNTRRIVASMASEQARWTRTMGDLKRNVRRTQSPSMVVFNQAVSRTGFMPLPYPARFSLLDSLPKAFFKCCAVSVAAVKEVTRFLAISRLPLINTGTSSHELLSAKNTDNRYAGRSAAACGSLRKHLGGPFVKLSRPRLLAQREGFPLPELYQVMPSWA